MVLTGCKGSPSRPLPTSNTDYVNIIGKPIRFGNLEITQYSFPYKMNWGTAKGSCEALRGEGGLGDGWRLPTKDELNILYKNKDSIGGFENDYYWSSTPDGSSDAAWLQNFVDGDEWDYATARGLVGGCYARAVRSVD